MLEKDKLFLSEQLASGEYGGESYNVVTSVPGRSVIVEFKEVRAIVAIEDIVECALIFIEKKLTGKDD